MIGLPYKVTVREKRLYEDGRTWSDQRELAERKVTVANVAVRRVSVTKINVTRVTAREEGERAVETAAAASHCVAPGRRTCEKRE